MTESDADCDSVTRDDALTLSESEGEPDAVASRVPTAVALPDVVTEREGVGLDESERVPVSVTDTLEEWVCAAERDADSVTDGDSVEGGERDGVDDTLKVADADSDAVTEALTDADDEGVVWIVGNVPTAVIVEDCVSDVVASGEGVAEPEGDSEGDAVSVKDARPERDADAERVTVTDELGEPVRSSEPE